MTNAMWAFLSILWVSGLGYAAWSNWLSSRAPHAEYEKRMTALLREFDAVRTEVSSLALAIGLRKKEQGQGPFHPSANVPPGERK